MTGLINHISNGKGSSYCCGEVCSPVPGSHGSGSAIYARVFASDVEAFDSFAEVLQFAPTYDKDFPDTEGHHLEGLGNPVPNNEKKQMSMNMVSIRTDLTLPAFNTRVLKNQPLDYLHVGCIISLYVHSGQP